eukprot:278587_1
MSQLCKAIVCTLYNYGQLESYTSHVLASRATNTSPFLDAECILMTYTSCGNQFACGMSKNKYHSLLKRGTIILPPPIARIPEPNVRFQSNYNQTNREWPCNTGTNAVVNPCCACDACSPHCTRYRPSIMYT